MVFSAARVILEFLAHRRGSTVDTAVVFIDRAINRRDSRIKLIVVIRLRLLFNSLLLKSVNMDQLFLKVPLTLFLRLPPHFFDLFLLLLLFLPRLIRLLLQLLNRQLFFLHLLSRYESLLLKLQFFLFYFLQLNVVFLVKFDLFEFFQSLLFFGSLLNSFLFLLLDLLQSLGFYFRLFLRLFPFFFQFLKQLDFLFDLLLGNLLGLL